MSAEQLLTIITERRLECARLANNETNGYKQWELSEKWKDYWIASNVIAELIKETESRTIKTSKNETEE